MAKVLNIAGRPSFNSIAGATRYSPIGDTSLNNVATESVTQTTYRTTGTFSNLYINITTNTTSASSTFNFRVNGANGNQTFSIGAGTTGEFSDTVNTDTIAAGDEVNVQFASGGTGSFNLNNLRVLFTASANTVKKFLNTGGINATADSTTFFYSLAGGTIVSASTEANTQAKFKTGGTAKNLFVNSLTNTRSTTTTWNSRLNGGNGNLTVSIGAGTTGFFEDTSNSDTIAVDDLYCHSFTTSTGGGNFNATAAVEFETTDSTTMMLNQGQGFNNSAVGTSATVYYPYGGRINNISDASTTEAPFQVDAGMAFTASKFEVYVSANSISATSTARTRVNGANGNQSVSITASTTGWFEDTANSDSVVGTDALNYQLVTGATGTSITLTTLASKLTITGHLLASLGAGN